MPTLRELFELGLLFHKINLVDHHKHRNTLLGDFGKEIGILRRIFNHIGHIDENVSIDERTFTEIEHALL